VVSSAQQATDAQLLGRSRAGDLAAYDELYRRHLPDARRVARIVTDDGEEAEDVVAEAFGRVLARVRDDSGPDDVLTPYLRAVIRRLAVDRHRAGSRKGHAADPAMLEELPTADDEIASVTDRQLVRAAFESLPERWQRVLWHTEIEGRPPATLTPALGSTPNAVAALAYRAREGLRQAFLAVHLAATAPPECRPFVPKLAAYVRQTLSQEEDVAVAVHLDTCVHCRERRDQLLLLVSDVRGVLVPALLGTLAADGVLTAAPAGAALAGTGAATAAATAAAAGTGAAEADQATGVSRFRPRGFVQVAAVSVASMAAAAALAFAAVSALSPSATTDEPAAAPPPVTSEQPATTGPAAQTPSRGPTPSPTAEPTEERTPTEVSRPLLEPSTAPERSGSSDDEADGNTPQRSRSTIDAPDDKKDGEPRSKPEPNAQGSGDAQGNQEPGSPPPSPWMCAEMPVLPWCD
jgi:RNA polymerase sigma factor (sigma-70 family)